MEVKNSYSFYLWIILQSLIAGYINVATIILFNANVSHHTGNISKLAIELYYGQFDYLLNILLLIVFFMVGSIVSGMLFHNKEFILNQRYGNLLIGFGIGYLIINILSLNNLVPYYSSFILGSQNSMFIFYNNILVRTTHFSGYLSDIGFIIVRIIRGEKEEISKIFFYLFNIVFFFIGGFISVLLINWNKHFILIAAGLFYLILGTYYFIYKKKFINN